MKRIRAIYLLPITAFLIVLSCGKRDTVHFEELHPRRTGVTFSNALKYTDSLTVLEFEYMYNGAGVAVADFDQDGWQDIYFTGNMVSNRLYRNLGEWKFEDVTEASGAGSTHWSNGVAVTDINQDGYPDIYVSRGGPRGSAAADRSNLLYVNTGMKDGKLSFREEAARWGLADESYSVQAAFFDYDRDGDLDMYLLSNALVDFNRNTSRPKDRTGKAPSADKLFRNNGDQTFTDISADAGILIEGFGLGVQVCDLNKDGWPDIYVSNDFLTDDLLYINQKDGTFANEITRYFRHLTFNGMGNDIADINNDGLEEVIVLDMLPEDNSRWKLTMMGNNYDEFMTSLSHGYHPQYIRNTLQLNNGNGSFSEVGQIAGISATEWSWSALFADFDHDGLRDLCITNGYRQDITNLDFMVYGNQILTMGTEEANRKQRLEELNKLPGIKLHNYFFRNEGDLRFKDLSKEAGFTKPTYSNGMAYADFDKDGDLDLVMNNIDDPALLYENTLDPGPERHYIQVKFKGPHPNIAGIGCRVQLNYQGRIQEEYFTPYRGYLSSMQPVMHFGLGAVAMIDSLKVTWPDGREEVQTEVPADNQITLDYKDATVPKPGSEKKEPELFFQQDSTRIVFSHKEDDFVDYKIQPLLPHMHSRNGPGLAVADVNGDGLEDCYIGGAAGEPGMLFRQQPDGSFIKTPFADGAGEDMGVLFFDGDNDGDQDLYLVSGGSSFPKGDSRYRDRIYVNDGSGDFSDSGGLPELASSGSVVTAADYDKDGYLDLFVGGRVSPGEYPLPPRSSLLHNKSKGGQLQFEEVTKDLPASFTHMGMVTSALWTDYNNDTWPDLIVAGEFMPVQIFQNKQGTLVDISETTGLSNSHGWWNSIAAGDFDQDGDMDYVLGNLGLNSRYRASKEEPLCIYAKDYDKNGQVDPVMCYYILGKNYVAHSRNDLIEQINVMRGRFRTYSDYAKVTFEESFLKEELTDALVVKSETFANSYMENLGNGKFSLTSLPRSAQIAPMYGMLVQDYTGDGLPDLLSVGNFYSGEVFSGRYDASIGWLLAGDGNGNFSAVDVRDSGFYVPGDAKSLVSLHSGNEEVIIATINNGPIVCHRFPGSGETVYAARAGDIAALITKGDGRIQKTEFQYGSGYLSQSSRSVRIPGDATSVIIVDTAGKRTEILPGL